MRRRVVSAFAAVALSLACSGIHAAPQTSAQVQLSWDVAIDASGEVTGLSTHDMRVPKLHDRLEKAIRGWQFTPGKVNGVAAETQTHLHTRIEVKLVADAFEVRLLSASTGSDYVTTTAPHYPEGAARAHAQGNVRLNVHYTSAGVVDSVEPYGDHKKIDQRLVHEATSSVRKWTFAPEVVGGHPIAGSALVPLQFCLSSGASATSCEFKDEETGKTIDSQEAVALNPAASLVSDVIGRTL